MIIALRPDERVPDTTLLLSHIPEDWQDERISADPQALVERAQTIEIVLCALQGLPAAQREIIILHDLEELNYQEIGVILGCSAISAKLRVFRARRTLRERVQILNK